MPATAAAPFEAALKASAADTEIMLGALLRDSASPRLLKAMRYAALSGGKRLRPFLVIQSAGLFGVPRQRALRVGAALECVHCFSLVHDDLPGIDNDDTRRGRPATHRQFDEATAILVGDALLALAFEILSDRKTHHESAVRLDLVQELARAAGKAGMVGGQMLDIEAETRKAGPAQIRRIQSGKTGALFRFACEAGAMLASAPRAALRRYADHMGLAFQVADDLLDVESSPQALGKATQKDQRQGKATFVDALGLNGARRLAKQEVEQAIKALSGYDARADTLRAAARFTISRKT